MEHKHINIPGTKENISIDYDIFFGKIIPKFIIEEGVPKQITKLHKKLHLEGLMIKRFNNKLKEVKIFGTHPNADLDTDELCLRDEEYGAVVGNIHALLNLLINRLEVYYFDESHFRPNQKDYETKPVDGFMKIDVNFEEGEIHDAETPFRRLYPGED